MPAQVGDPVITGGIQGENRPTLVSTEVKVDGTLVDLHGPKGE